MTAAAKSSAAQQPRNGRLIVEDLHVSYSGRANVGEAVKGVSFAVEAGEILGIVGASGSGKSSIGYAIMRLLPDSAKTTGAVSLGGDNVLEYSERQMRSVRGPRIGMIFQDPSAALNPVFKIGSQIVDTLRYHNPGMSRAEATRIAGERLEEMGIPAARLGSYPHQLSGGMRQRALIAAAMAANPGFIVADEPTSDLDTVSQAQILSLLRRLRDDRTIGIVLISHDMSVVASICDRVGVMRNGLLVELGTSQDVLTRPQHPYTQALVHVSRRDRDENRRFVTMPRDYDMRDQRVAEPAAAGRAGEHE
jgi:ABC-type dipeptide/oligopeptide/nickel transport system ATPase component